MMLHVVLFALATTASLLVSAAFAQDVCSTWVPLACGGYTPDTLTAVQPCTLSNRTSTGLPNSFDTGLRPTSPTSSLTYCDQLQIYDFSVPPAVQNNTRTIVTLIGSTVGAQATTPSHESQIHVVTSAGLQYIIGSVVHGFNSVVGQQAGVTRPSNPALYSYPFNGILACSKQVALQPWVIPPSLLGQTITKIRIYDPQKVIKVYSITIDTCGSYAGNPAYADVTTALGYHVSNKTIEAVDANLGYVVTPSTNVINSWPACALACYDNQLGAPQAQRCVGFAHNATSRQCYLLSSMRSVVVSNRTSSASLFWVGVLPPQGLSLVQPIPSVVAGGLASTPFYSVMMTRPDLLGAFPRKFVLVGYRRESGRSQSVFLHSAATYALSVTQSSYLQANFLASFAALQGSGAGGRMSVCGSPLGQGQFGVPFVNNNTLTSCTSFGHCLPQAVGTAGNSLTGPVTVMFQESPFASNSCGSFSQVSSSQVGYLLMVSTDGTLYEGPTYSLATIQPQSSNATLVRQALAAAYYVPVADVSVTEITRFTTAAAPSSTANSVFSYTVSGYSGSSTFVAPQWFRSDSDFNSYAASVRCNMHASFPYTTVAGNQAMPVNRYSCNAYPTLFHLIEACNNDSRCAGVTTLATNATAEVAWCLVDNATIETADPLALNANATMLLKSWNLTASPLACSVNTAGSYMVAVAVAQGFLNGTLGVYADETLIATCPSSPVAAFGNDACSVYTTCFNGTIALGTAAVSVRLVSIGFPIVRQCDSILFSTLITYDTTGIVPTVTTTCGGVNAAAGTSCTTTTSSPGQVVSGPLSAGVPSPLCGIHGNLSSGIAAPNSFCSGSGVTSQVVFTFPTTAVTEAVYLSVDFANVSATARGSAQFSVTIRDTLNRQLLIGYLSARASTADSVRAVGIGRASQTPQPLCANMTYSLLQPSTTVLELPVPNAMLVNGITSVTIQGQNISVLQVSGLKFNLAGCPRPIRRNPADSAAALGFYYLAPGVYPTTGLVLATVTTGVRDFTECAALCSSQPGTCGVYTYFSANATCVLRNAAGLWHASPALVANLMSGTLARTAQLRSFPPLVAPGGFTATVASLSSRFANVLLFGSALLPSQNAVLLQIMGLTSYQIAMAQTNLGGDAMVFSALDASGGMQLCGNHYARYLSAVSSAADGSCASFISCDVINLQFATNSPLEINAAPNSALGSGAMTSCSGMNMYGLLGFATTTDGGQTSSSYWRVDIAAVSSTPLAGEVGSGIVEMQTVTYNGLPQLLVLRDSEATPPNILVAGALTQTSLCRIVTRTTFRAYALSGFLSGTSYSCGAFATIADAMTACRSDSRCNGFTVASDNTVGCLTTSANFTTSSTTFVRKLTTTSCVFDVRTSSIISISVLEINLFRGSGNNVIVRWNGRQVRKCGSSRPFYSGAYSTSSVPQCGTYLQCFNDLLPGIGTLEVVFPENSTTVCSVYQSAVVVITPQQSASYAIDNSAGRQLRSVRSVKFSTPSLRFNMLQQGSTRVAVLVKQDRFFAVSATNSFALNVSVGSTVMSLCGGSVGWAEGNGLSNQCSVYYYCGRVTQGSPLAVAGLSGPITVAIENASLTSTANCNGRFEALVLTDGMLVTATQSQSSYRTMFVSLFTTSEFVNSYGGNANHAIASIQANTTALALAFPSLRSPSSILVYPQLFTFYESVASAPSAYYALVDDVNTPDENKVIVDGYAACVVDQISDETIDQGCDLQLGPTQNFIEVKVAQSNFNLVGRTIQVIVNDVTVATCGGDQLFLGYQGISALCNNYFVCFSNFVQVGALVRLVFSQSAVATSPCTPAVVALLRSEAAVFVPPLVCSSGVAPFACNADRTCLSTSLVCNDINDCSDRSDEGRCHNWRFVGNNVQANCAPQIAITSGITLSQCIRAAVIAQTPTYMQYNASVCALFSCVDFSQPNVSVVSSPSNASSLFQTWIYTTSPSSFFYCTSELHCSNNGLVASSVPPCVCACFADYTGESCNSQLDLALISGIVGVLGPSVPYNISVVNYFTSAILVALPTGSIVTITSVQTFNVTRSGIIALATAMYLKLTDYTGRSLSQLSLNSLLTYATRASIIESVPGLETVTATSVVGPTGRVVCYITSFAVEGYTCVENNVNVNQSRKISVTVTGISFSSPSQYMDVTLIAAASGTANTTVRCSPSDFVQYRDSVTVGVCSYLSVCEKTVEGVSLQGIALTASPGVNPGNVNCNGYQLLASATVAGVINGPSSSLVTQTPSYTTSHNAGYAVITAALGAVGLLCCVLLGGWFRFRRKYETIRPCGPIFGFLAWAFMFGAMCGIAFFVGEATEAYTHVLVLEEYRDPQCADNFFSFLPTRVSHVFVQSPTCQPIEAVGPAEGLFYLQANVLVNASTGVADQVAIRHGSKVSCLATAATIIPTGVCLRESEVFPEKSASELSFLYATVYRITDGTARVQLLKSYSPTLPLTSLATVTAVTTGDYFNGGSVYRYRTEGGLFGFQTAVLSDASVFHLALRSSGLSNADDPSFVRFVATITTASTALSSEATYRVESLPYIATRSNVTNAGTSFNNFNSTSTDALEASGPAANSGSNRYFGIAGSSINAGRLRGFTVSFWIQASPTTRGFVYAVVDGWVLRSDYSSRIVDQLFDSVESGTSDNPWYSSDWHCYHSVYISGPSRLLAFVSAAPGRGVSVAVWDLQNLGLLRLFDEGWHYVTVVVNNAVASSPTARLYVDGQTERNIEGWYQCVNDQVNPVQGFDSNGGTGANVRVINALQESVIDGGVLVLGAINARLFNFAIIPSTLTQEEVTNQGAPGMELYSAIARVESLGFGIATLLLSLVSIFYAARHIWTHFFGLPTDISTDSDEELGGVVPGASHADDRTVDPDEAAKAVGGSTFNIFDQSVPFYQFIQPVLMTVQVMALYMYAWEWPATYTSQFFGFFAIFSFDFQIVHPTTSTLLWPAVQFALASCLLFLLITFAWKDRESFRATVLQYSELVRLRLKRANPFGTHGVAEVRAARPEYRWVFHNADGDVTPLSDEQEETLLRCLQQMMARRLKTDANMRLHTPRLVSMGSLGTGIILYERVNGKIFVSFRASDHSAQEDRDASKITLTSTTIECVADNTTCPEHNLRLLPDDLMQYTCVHSPNPYYRSMECPKRCIMFACPHELCDYAVCEFCYNGGTVQAAVSSAIAAMNHLRRRGFFAVAGMALVELASAVYLPVVKSAMMIIGCNSVFICAFGSCWISPTWRYILGLLFAFSALIFFGGGYFVVNAVVAWERHFLLRSALPNRPPKRLPLFSWLPVINEVKEADFDDFLQLDETLLVTLYQPFRFPCQWFPVVLYVFRFVLPAAVFVTDSGGLPQLAAAVVLETFLSAAVVAAAPFKSIWIELLSRLGSIHQLVQLGLMSLHRVYVRDHPGDVGYGAQMGVATVVYLGIVALLLVVIVIVPSIQRQWKAYQRKRKEQTSTYQEQNYDVGVFGQHKSRAMQQLEAKAAKQAK